MPVIIDGTTGIALTSNAGLTQTGSGLITLENTLKPNSGGTGLASPGTSGNVLTSNGTSWISQAPVGGGGGGAGTINITNETVSAASYYPLLSTSNTGNLATANTSSQKFYFVPSTGTLSATVFNALSDKNYKTDVETITNALDIVSNLRGVTFRWIDSGEPSIGLIAQEVETQLPEIVADHDGIKTLNYDAIIGILVESIKELKARVDLLENK